MVRLLPWLVNGTWQKQSICVGLMYWLFIVVKKRVFLTGITVLIRKEKWQSGELMTFQLI